ncbi:hypothetical protein Pmani_015721 [Petrolisthes manimaculis]|uniref:Carbohydrate sulfotransferase n=1 Tax=Petrolisthes manimaculis TaxID=1843537 RepID=A0AAE1PTA4_9EUCA|nr:hypothetical protein Pmani_015721 [Petrolisthes manimaculis]
MWPRGYCMRLLLLVFLIFFILYFISPSIPTFPVKGYGSRKSPIPRPILTLSHDPPPILGDNDTKALIQTERRMRTRVAVMREACRKKTFQSPSKITTDTLNSAARARTVALEEVKLLVCVVYKAGSTALNLLLAHLYNNTKIIQSKMWYKMLDVLRPSFTKFEEQHKSSDYMKVVMVREPLERLLSAYRNRIQDQSINSFQARHFGPIILQATRDVRYSKQSLFHVNGTLKIVPTFHEFVQYLVEKLVPQEYDPHWKPIHLLCSLCNLNYTDIVHMETYDEDIHYVMRKTGLISEIDEGFLQKGKHEGRGNTQALLVSFYSKLEPSLLEQITQVYRRDFILLGYDPTNFLHLISPNTTINWRGGIY